MVIKNPASSTAHLFRYVLASADMYYAELEQRDVFIGADANGHVRIWAETVNGGQSTKIELCRVFLEYAMYCASSFGPAEAQYQMQGFGERLGHQLAAYLRRNPGLLTSQNPALGALECVFGTIGAHFFEDYAQAGVRFLVTDCPLEEAAKRSGLSNIELARHGVNAMCTSLCVGMNPQVVVSTSPANRPELMFTLSLPVAA